ncbi:ATP-binding cassette domain-containing protein [Streptobacillus felis]|uniref:ATP-binding cassette domain-containing protein n=1 Tax=Streptobacillus felis TaxID=1384509 RepID=A0A7Z0PGN2_9FUSO|nr:ATP-binding cassette domain-containing protein [Streptobacillus felis]NYV28217.1 ATP-binding cassette domain-containing protein [Streptobacillus felis]
MPYLSIEKLTKKFDEKIAVNSVNLEISKGEIFGIIGLSGAGKSTLIRMINKLDKPTTGTIKHEDKDIFLLNDKETREYRKKTSIIFQSFNLLSSRTVFENVSLPLEISKVSKSEINEKVNQLLSLVGLDKFKNEYVNNLSGGQKQRVAIARALSTDPEILLSDESTSSLDPITSNSILELLKDINVKLGITIILITHQMEVIKKICDRVAVMKDGEVIEVSTVKDLFLNPKTKFSKELISDLKIEVQTGKANTLNLFFDGDQADKPYVSELTREFNIDINIFGGSIDTLASGVKVGHLNVGIETDNIEEVISWLEKEGIKVEVVK